MIKKIILASLFVFISLSIQAQKEAYNWYFGYNAGLTWHTTRSYNVTKMYGSAVSGGQLTGLPDNISTLRKTYTSEGTFSLSDSDGNLLFYSDGMGLWDEAGTQYGGSLLGHSSSTQSGIIMPYPGTTKKYIMFTAYTDKNTSADAFHGYVVDLTSGTITIGLPVSLINGKGTIHGESINAIMHANKKDFWVVTPGRGATNPDPALTNAAFNAWLVTKDGIQNENPTKVSVIPYNLVTTSHPSGYLKFSPTGEYFAWGENSNSNLYVGKFNNATGEFYDIKQIKLSGNTYGLEFSRSGKYLYSTGPVSGSGSISAFDVEGLVNGSSTGALISYNVGRFQIDGSNLGLSPTALQLAPDNRMYAALRGGGNEDYASGSDRLIVVDNLEDPMNLDMYVTNTGFIGGGGRGHSGLPSFSPSWFDTEINGINDICAGTEHTFSMLISVSGAALANLHHIKWDFGDGAGSVINSSSVTPNEILKQAYKYNTPGTYTIKATGRTASDVLISEMGETILNVEVKRCYMPINKSIRNNVIDKR